MADDREPGVLHKALGIEPPDAPFYGWIVLGGILINGGGELAWGLATGRFLATLGGEAMPTLYVCVSLFSIGTFFAAARSGGDGSGGGRLPGLVAAVSAAFLAMALIPGQDIGAFVFLSLVVARIYPILHEPEYLGWVAGIVPLQVSKRVAPGVGASAALGRVVGAFLAMDPLGIGSVERLLLLAAGLNAATLLCLSRAGSAAKAYASQPAASTPPAPAAPAPAPSPASSAALLSESLHTVRTSPLLRRVAFLCLLSGCFFGTADYPLSVTAPGAIGGEAELAAFYGALSVGLNLMTMVVGLFGTGLLLARIGLGSTLAVLPLGMALGGLLGAATPGFPVAVGVLLGYFLLARVAHTPASLLLLNVVPPRLADAVRGLTFGVPMSAGLLLSGLALRATSPELPAVYLGLLIAGGLGLLAARGSEQAYLTSLLENLGDAEAPEALLPRRATVRALVATGDPALADAVSGAVARIDPEAVDEALIAALPSLPPDSRVAAMTALARAHLLGPVAGHLAEAMLTSDDPTQVEAAARGAAALGDVGRVPALRSSRETAQGLTALVLAGAIARLAHTREDLEPALRQLAAGLRSPEPGHRAEAVRLLGELRHSSLHAALECSLADPEPEVVEHAARALGRTHHPASLEALQQRLDEAEAATESEDMRAALRASIDHIRRFTAGGVVGVLETCDARERQRLTRSLGELSGGERLRCMTVAMAAESRSIRGYLVALVRDASEEQLHRWGPGFCAPNQVQLPPLLPDAFAEDAALDGPLISLLAASLREPGDPMVEPWRAVLEDHLRARLEGEPASHAELERLATILDLFPGEPRRRTRALAAALGSEPRQAEIALELLAGTGGDAGLRPRFLELVQRARGGPSS